MLESKYGIKCPYITDKIGITVHNTANSAPASNEIRYMINNNEKYQKKENNRWLFKKIFVTL